MEAAQKELFEDIFGDGSEPRTEAENLMFRCLNPKCGAEFDEPRQCFNFGMQCPKCGCKNFEVV